VSSPRAKRSLRGQHHQRPVRGRREPAIQPARGVAPLDTSRSPGSLDSRLAKLKSKVTCFRQSIDEVTRNLKALPVATSEWLPGPDERGAPCYWTVSILLGILRGRSKRG
jgi:hypothetical protein